MKVYTHLKKLSLRQSLILSSHRPPTPPTPTPPTPLPNCTYFVLSQETLCGLEIEGIGRFLRGYREEDGPPSPIPVYHQAATSPLPPYACTPRGNNSDNVSDLVRSLTINGGKSGDDCCSTIRKKPRRAPALPLSSAAAVLRATGRTKVTRSTLERLQQDFAVQVLYGGRSVFGVFVSREVDLTRRWGRGGGVAAKSLQLFRVGRSRAIK